jgi:hypothetical protein
VHLDSIRQEIREELPKRIGFEISEEMFEQVMSRGSNGLEYLLNARNGTVMFRDWFRAVKAEEIDVGVVGKSPYDLILAAFGLPGLELSHSHVLYRGFIPENMQSDIEKLALNEFWRLAIEVLKSHYPFGVAA